MFHWRSLVVLVPLLIGAANSASAQHEVCGDAPVAVDLTAKGDIDSKATFLKRFVGELGFKGQVEIARTDVLNKYPNADKFRLDQYFLYVTCMMIMRDNNLSTEIRLEKLNAARAVIYPPKSDSQMRQERHAYIYELGSEDRVLAASLIFGQREGVQLDPDNVAAAFQLNIAIFSHALDSLSKKRLVSVKQHTASSAFLGFPPATWVTYSVTPEGLRYLANKNLVR